MPGRDQPYVVARRDVPRSTGLDPVTVDFELKRGVWIEGRVTDKATGKPLQRTVEYFSVYDNPNLRDYAGFDGTILTTATLSRRRGTAHTASSACRGRGWWPCTIRSTTCGHRERADEFGGQGASLRSAPYHMSFTSNYSALAKVDPAVGAESVRRGVTLDPGRTFKGTVVGPDGKPLAGARGFA